MCESICEKVPLKIDKNITRALIVVLCAAASKKGGVPGCRRPPRPTSLVKMLPLHRLRHSLFGLQFCMNVVSVHAAVGLLQVWMYYSYSYKFQCHSKGLNFTLSPSGPGLNKFLCSQDLFWPGKTSVLAPSFTSMHPSAWVCQLP